MAIEPTLIAAMDCTELERSIDAYLDGEFDARERIEVDTHLAGCARCRTLAEEQRRLRDAIRARLREAMAPPAPGGRAPAALRARIEESLARQRRPLWRRALSPIPIATLAACAAGALLVLQTHDGRNGALVEEAISKHHRSLPLEVVAASVGSEGMITWFADKLDFHPAPPHFRADGVRPVGARLSHLREWPAAYIRYELPRGQAGLFIVDDPDRRFDASGRQVRIGPSLVRLVTARGYNVAVWRNDEIVYSLVSDLDEKALYELVRTAQRDTAR
jgi:anti-sigma factor RsiW